MPYSPVTQPLPWPFKNDGTPSSTVAVQITRVLPISINTLPSALGIKSGVNFTGRIWSCARPSLRKVPPRDMDSSLTAAYSSVNRTQEAAWLNALLVLPAPEALDSTRMAWFVQCQESGRQAQLLEPTTKPGIGRTDRDARRASPPLVHELESSIVESHLRSRQASARWSPRPVVRSEFLTESRLRGHPKNPRRPCRQAEGRTPAISHPPARCVDSV